MLRRRPIGVILVFSDLAPVEKHKLRSRGVNFVVVDPADEPEPDVGLDRVGELGRRARGGAASDRSRAPAHRDDQRARGHALLGRPRRRVPVGAGARRDRLRRRIWSARATSTSPAATAPRPQLLDLEQPPTAIFAGSDLQALGVYEAARPRGIRIPDDLSVVGYDDLRIARWVGPPLTTIRQPLVEMAETAARLLIRMVEDPEAPMNQRVDLATSWSYASRRRRRGSWRRAARGTPPRASALSHDTRSGSCTLGRGFGSGRDPVTWLRLGAPVAPEGSRKPASFRT